jgi:hypothetical protein
MYYVSGFRLCSLWNWISLPILRAEIQNFDPGGSTSTTSVTVLVTLDIKILKSCIESLTRLSVGMYCQLRHLGVNFQLMFSKYVYTLS